MKKKDVPLALLRVVEPIINEIDRNRFSLEKPDSNVMKIVDLESGSDFFYEIFGFKRATNDTLIIHVRYKPHSEVNTVLYETALPLGHISGSFNNWYKLVDSYQGIKTPFDDPILEKYKEEFYAKFESADEDADTAGFTIEQQLLLDEGITKIIYQLEAKKDDTNKEEIDVLIKEAVEIQETLTISTKKEVLNKLSTVFAKIQKGGLKLIKDIYPIIQKEVISMLVKGTLNELPSVSDITQHLG